MDNQDNIDVYELTFNDKVDGVFGISLVSVPAIGIDFMKFSEEIKFSADTEKRVITSPVLIPKQMVYRNNINGKPGKVFLSEESIEQLQQNFFKNGYQSNSTLEHDGIPLDGVFFFESWIVQDSNNDKAKALGFNVPNGTWMVSMKIENNEIWEESVKTGKVKGLSMDSMLQINKVLFNAENKNDQNKFVKMNKEMLDKIIAESIKAVTMAADLKEFVAEDGKSYYAEDLALDMIVTNKEGAVIPNATFTYEGKYYETDANGVITSIEDVKAEESEEAQEEITESVEQAEEGMEMDPAQAEDPNAECAEKDAKIAELESKVMELEGKIVKLEEELVLSKEENIAMSNQTPASIGIIDVDMASESEKTPTGLLGAIRKLNKK